MDSEKIAHISGENSYPGNFIAANSYIFGDTSDLGDFTGSDFMFYVLKSKGFWDRPTRYHFFTNATVN